MNILYVRVSTAEQNTDRQRVSEKDFNLVIEDRCSGAVPFFERPGGKEIWGHAVQGRISTLAVWQIDRLGRNLRDIINTIHWFTERGISIHFISQGLKTLEGNGAENPITKMIISVLGVVSEMERSQLKERQMEGIRIAKARGRYTGRKAGTDEDVLTFLSKPKNRKAAEYLNKGYKVTEAATLAKVHTNTVYKIKKLLTVTAKA